MRGVTAEVRALLQDRQDRRKAELITLPWDVKFAVGNEVLLDSEHAARRRVLPLPLAALGASLVGPSAGEARILRSRAPRTPISSLVGGS